MSARVEAMDRLRDILGPTATKALAAALLHEVDLAGDPQACGSWQGLADVLDLAADIARKLSDTAGRDD